MIAIRALKLQGSRTNTHPLLLPNSGDRNSANSHVIPKTALRCAAFTSLRRLYLAAPAVNYCEPALCPLGPDITHINRP